MSQFIRLMLKTVAIACLPMTVALSSYAQSADRTDQLEREIREIKIRLSNLEAAQGKSIANPKPVASGEGWKVLSNWRSLKSGMTLSDVRTVLGEPDRVDGGVVAHWYYANGGTATFVGDELTQWREPKHN
jgi:outer membrane protein assembly factor BamE (lipoprotein component of BamABCDE complex)